jgi:hypothetical protein
MARRESQRCRNCGKNWPTHGLSPRPRGTSKKPRITTWSYSRPYTRLASLSKFGSRSKNRRRPPNCVHKRSVNAATRNNLALKFRRASRDPSDKLGALSMMLDARRQADLELIGSEEADPQAAFAEITFEVYCPLISYERYSFDFLFPPRRRYSQA